LSKLYRFVHKWDISLNPLWDTFTVSASATPRPFVLANSYSWVFVGYIVSVWAGVCTDRPELVAI